MHMFIIHRKIQRQAGVSIVTAIFLIVVLALMGIGMVSLLSTSKQSISQEITSAKAYLAGRTCLQWGMYQAVYTASTGSHTNTFNNNTACATSLTSITADGLTFYNINTVASFGSLTDPEFSQREMRLQFQP